uniref:Arf-GAP domain-containing protein n=1 Tax=Compsopogon caeruleus TaxID=31354 RepID=A0A7S1XDK9_9RHOD|mmetsp:Transcript_14797/g.30115  ORF Transcript_14797/g.30115 Transcript_14797/m.30115 type:complete len:369 (+) Transcript_14797:230-1336(+)
MASEANLGEKGRKDPALNKNHQAILMGMMREQHNRTCADCGTTNPRWASANLGVFLCIDCSGIHRKMGTHVSTVRSTTLDTWTATQIERMQKLGNTKVNSIFEECLPSDFARPTVTSPEALERFIRDKYEKRRYVRKELGGQGGISSKSLGPATMASKASFHCSEPRYDSRPRQPSPNTRCENVKDFQEGLLFLQSRGIPAGDAALALRSTHGDAQAALEKLKTTSTRTSNLQGTSTIDFLWVNKVEDSADGKRVDAQSSSNSSPPDRARPAVSETGDAHILPGHGELKSRLAALYRQSGNGSGDSGSALVRPVPSEIGNAPRSQKAWWEEAQEPKPTHASASVDRVRDDQLFADLVSPLTKPSCDGK